MPGPEADDNGADLGGTFDAASELYQRARPDYPAALIDAVIEITGVRAGDRLLEIGCATGKATLPFARRGFRITCIEPGRTWRLRLEGTSRRTPT